MDYHIRPIKSSDLVAFVNLCTEHAAYEKAEIEMAGKAEALKKAFETQRLYGWVVEVNKKLVGYATATLDYSTWDAAEFLHMDCLYLKEEARGQGLGEKLVLEIVKLAKEKNCVNVQWQTPDWNTEALRFYQRLGASSKPKVRFFLDRKAIQVLRKKEMHHEHTTHS
jgi:ribosomal protein S18 acetylase RimI-like enzyme